MWLLAKNHMHKSQPYKRNHLGISVGLSLMMSQSQQPSRNLHLETISKKNLILENLMTLKPLSQIVQSMLSSLRVKPLLKRQPKIQAKQRKRYLRRNHPGDSYHTQLT